MENGSTKRRCVCWHQTRTHAKGSGRCRGLGTDEQGCYCGGTRRECVCGPRVREACSCEAFVLAAVRLPTGEWTTATDGGPVCGAPFPGTSYTCDLAPHEWGRCFVIDTELVWHRQRTAEAVAS